MDKKNKKYYDRLTTFLEKLRFFDKKFISYIENKISFVKDVGNNKDICVVTTKKGNINNISLVLPYPNSYQNFILCLDGICEAYVYYLIKKKIKVDDDYLETLKMSVKRVYVEENLSEKIIRLYNISQLKALKELNEKQIIGLALSFEIANEYAATGCFIVPEEYFFDADKARTHAEIELNYILGN